MKKYLTLFFFTLLFSCNQEFENVELEQSILEKSTIGRIDASLYNGILKFETQSDFDNSIESIKDSDSDQLKLVFDDLYQQGFEPLYFHTDDNEFAKDLLYKRNFYLPVSLRQENEFEKSDELVFDDLFASLLNYKRQLIIQDKLYMFTFHGLLEGDYRSYLLADDIVSDNNLNDLLDELPQSDSTTPVGHNFNLIVEAIGVNNPNTGCEFAAEPVFCNIFEDYNNTGGSTSSPSDEDILNESFDDVVSKSLNLEICNDRSSFRIFGTRRVCSKRLVNREQRRTRIEFSNFKFFNIYESYELNTIHQRRKSFLGISWWDTQFAHEIGMLVNNATFVLNNSNYNGQPHPSLPNDLAHYYYLDGVALCYPDFNPTSNMLSATLSGTPNNEDNRPNTPFGEDIIVHVVGASLPALPHQDTTVQAQILFSYFENNIKDKAIQTWGQNYANLPKTFTIIYSYNAKSIVQHIDFGSRAIHFSSVTKTLDSAFNGKVGFTLTVPPNGQAFNPITDLTNIEQFTWNSPLTYLWDYDHYSIDFVGYSRRDNEESYVRMNYIKD